MRLRFPDAAAKRIMDEVAAETGVMRHVVESIVKSEFWFVENNIRNTKGKDIFLSKFGRWRVKIHKMKHRELVERLIERNEEKRPYMKELLDTLTKEYEGRSNTSLPDTAGCDETQRGGGREAAEG